jgi:hypothetical protein
MRYVRQELLEAARKAVRTAQQQQHRSHAEKVTAHGRAVTAWNANHADSWRAAVRVITRKLKTGDPITAADLPHKPGQSHLTATFGERRPEEFKPWVPSELEVLIKVLELVADDVVTTAALRDLGISVSTMRTCAEYMAAGSVRA